MTTPRIARGFTPPDIDGPDMALFSNEPAIDEDRPVVILWAEDYERIVAALWPFAAVGQPFMSVDIAPNEPLYVDIVPDNQNHQPAFTVGDVRDAAEILKEIEGER